MKFLITISLLLSAPSAFAFLSNAEEELLLQNLNQKQTAVTFEEIRCSLRNRLCLVRYEANGANKACLIERINDASELYNSEVDQNGKVVLNLSNYAQREVERCLQ
ncbi:hypothetical protein ACES2L_14420 [Bdellovibrio bacteriovorus]